MPDDLPDTHVPLLSRIGEWIAGLVGLTLFLVLLFFTIQGVFAKGAPPLELYELTVVFFLVGIPSGLFACKVFLGLISKHEKSTTEEPAQDDISANKE